VSNVVVEVTGDDGAVRGYGEAAPRSYVTGESQASVVRSIRRLVEGGPFPWRLEDASQIWDYVDSLPKQRETNSAVCALEMCLLDALGRRQEKPVLDYFPTDHRQDTVRYGAVFPLASREKIADLSRFARAMKIERIKLKVGSDIRKNEGALKAVQKVYENRADILIDVNMAWDPETALRHAPLIGATGVRVVEQPMVPGHPAMGDFCALMASRDVRVMADESACTLEETERVFDAGHYTMMHVRLSKCGGLRRSLEIVRNLRRRGVPFAVGCQLGESGILSAAGRVISLLCNDAAYYHCCYDEFLLEENTTTEDVSFGMGGAAGPLNGPGLGVRVDSGRLERVSAGREAMVLSRPWSRP
jgi:L-alanine-DL-glutamate epimerase-like enolase superfamily enzyme